MATQCETNTFFEKTLQSVLGFKLNQRALKTVLKYGKFMTKVTHLIRVKGGQQHFCLPDLTYIEKICMNIKFCLLVINSS